MNQNESMYINLTYLINIEMQIMLMTKFDIDHFIVQQVRIHSLISFDASSYYENSILSSSVYNVYDKTRYIPFYSVSSMDALLYLDK